MPKKHGLFLWRVPRKSDFSYQLLYPVAVKQKHKSLFKYPGLYKKKQPFDRRAMIFTKFEIHKTYILGTWIDQSHRGNII